MAAKLKCPKCRKSGNIISLKDHHKNESGKHVAHAMHAAHTIGGPAGILIGAGAFLLNKALEKEYKCQSCKHEFSFNPSSSCQWCTGKTNNMYTTNCCKTRICENCKDERSSYKCDFCDKYI